MRYVTLCDYFKTCLAQRLYTHVREVAVNDVNASQPSLFDIVMIIFVFLYFFMHALYLKMFNIYCSTAAGLTV